MAEKKADVGLTTPIDKQTRLCSWGANGHGQLGIGSREDQLLPVEVKVIPQTGDGDAILDLGGGGGLSYILLGSGAVLTCGNNDKGQLGHGAQPSDQGGQPLHEVIFGPCRCDVITQLKAVQVAAGWDFMVSRCGNGSVFSWGSNAFGQLGRDLEKTGAKHSSIPGMVTFPKNVNQSYIAAGLRHVVSLAADGSVFAWGHGRRGQLGSEAVDGKLISKSDIPILVPMSHTDSITSVFAGMYNSGVLSTLGDILVWGCNKYGQCGTKPDTAPIVHVPTKVHISFKEEGEKPVEVCSGWTHLVARTSKGRLYSWGRKDLGQLGRSCDQTQIHLPAIVEGLESVKKHGCGSEHNLALTYDGVVYSWGWNEHGICATGDEENVPYPQEVVVLDDLYVENVGCAAGHSFCTGFQIHT